MSFCDRWLMAVVFLASTPAFAGSTLKPQPWHPRVAAPQAFACGEIGERCDASADCCANFCSYQTCMDPSGAGSSAGSDCRYGGDSCQSGSDCCSSECTDYGVCR